MSDPSLTDSFGRNSIVTKPNKLTEISEGLLPLKDTLRELYMQ